MPVVNSVSSAARASIEDRVKAIIGDVSGVKPETLASADVLAAIKGWDSMSVLDLMVHVEQAFTLRLEPGSLEAVVTVADLVDLVIAAGGHAAA
jgi:acyl carrier protein